MSFEVRTCIILLGFLLSFRSGRFKLFWSCPRGQSVTNIAEERVSPENHLKTQQALLRPQRKRNAYSRRNELADYVQCEGNFDDHMLGFMGDGDLLHELGRRTPSRKPYSCNLFLLKTSSESAVGFHDNPQ